MSKLPLETRPIRIAPLVAAHLEEQLKPLSGSALKAAQDAILEVFHSGQQLAHGDWIAAYDRALAQAAKKDAKKGGAAA